MNNFDIADIKELEKTYPDKELRLHWESDESEAERTTPKGILSDIADGDYTEEQFDGIGYCVTEEEYQEEQSQD
jgi:hypothetical protein